LAELYLRCGTRYVEASAFILAGIWCEILELDHVGVHDNFFELGGHSLSAIQMMVRLRDSLGLELPLRSVFEAPTIAQLTVPMGAVGAKGVGSFPVLTRQTRAEVVPASFAQEQLLRAYSIESPGTASYLSNIIGLVGKLDVGSLERRSPASP
jgi:acyl carrier protein